MKNIASKHTFFTKIILKNRFVSSLIFCENCQENFILSKWFLVMSIYRYYIDISIFCKYRFISIINFKISIFLIFFKWIFFISYQRREKPPRTTLGGDKHVRPAEFLVGNWNAKNFYFKLFPIESIFFTAFSFKVAIFPNF